MIDAARRAGAGHGFRLGDARPDALAEPFSARCHQWTDVDDPAAEQDSFGKPLPSAGLPDPGAVRVLSNAIGQAGQSADLAPGAASAPDPRTVHSLGGGKVTGAGWQYPDDHSAGLGWRVYVQDPNGYRTGYGHMDPSSTPSVGTIVNAGDPLGVYADPTNGSSTGPHVHVIKYGPDQKPIDPGTASPLTNGKITTTFGKIDKSHPTPHNGVDWAAPR